MQEPSNFARHTSPFDTRYHAVLYVPARRDEALKLLAAPDDAARLRLGLACGVTFHFGWAWEGRAVAAAVNAGWRERPLSSPGELQWRQSMPGLWVSGVCRLAQSAAASTADLSRAESFARAAGRAVM